MSASYLDILLNIDINGKLTTQLYDKRDDISFSILNFPYLCSNIPSSPAYGVYFKSRQATYRQVVVAGIPMVVITI